ncbi:erh [Symbiodinium microadriaticum]|nr:erh [Symbiodinium sp. KB8]CAE7325894.1 erh [Symbiodinium microadriaticum]
MDDVCQMYEQVMKMDMGGRQQVKYTVEDLWSFVDRLRDIACLIYDSQGGEYLPHNREWVKNQVLKHLKGQLTCLRQPPSSRAAQLSDSRCALGDKTARCNEVFFPVLEPMRGDAACTEAAFTTMLVPRGLWIVMVSSEHDRTCLIQGQLRQTGKVVGLLEDDGAKAEAVPATLVQQTSQSSLQADFVLVSPMIFETLCVPALALAIGSVLQQYPGTQSSGLLVSFFGAQTAMNLYMKQVFSNLRMPGGFKGVPAPFAITAIQQLVSFIVLAVGLQAARCFGYQVNCRRLESRREVGCVLLLALAFVGNIGLNNLSLSILDISVHLIIRTAGALVNLALEFVAQPILTKFTGHDAKWPQVNCRDLVLTIVGTFFAGLVICSKLQSFASASSASNYYVGIGVCCLSMVASGIELIVVRTLSSHLKMNALEAIMNMSLPASLLLLLPVFFFRHSVSWPVSPHLTDWEVMKTVWRTSKLGIALGVLSGFFATLYNVMLYTLSSSFQSHVISMAGNFNKVALMFLSIYLGMELLPDRPWGEVMIAGIAGNGVAFMVMGILKSQEAKAQETATSAAVKAEK